MFRTRTAVGRFMVRVGMNERYPADNMYVGKRNNTSQVRDENRRKAVLQVFSVSIRHSGAKIVQTECRNKFICLCRGAASLRLLRAKISYV